MVQVLTVTISFFLKIEDSSPTKKLKSSDESEYQVNNLKTKKQDLEDKLKQISKDLQNITSVMEQKKKPLSPVKRNISPVPATKSRRSAKTPQTVTAGRPVRERRKSTILREAEGSVVELSPSLSACKNLLRTLMTHKYAYPFNLPVDPIALGIPDYPSIIKHPMDFGTIKNYLESGKYEDLNDFGADMNLVFNNACTYNHPGSDVYIMAETLRTLFKKKMEIIEVRENQRVAKSSMSEEGVIMELRKSLDTMRQELQQLVQTTPTTQKKPQPAVEVVKKPEVIPMSKNEIKKLGLAINSLSYEHLSAITEIIKQSMPHLSESESSTVDINKLDPATLRKLETYVNSVKDTRKKSFSPCRGSPLSDTSESRSVVPPADPNTVFEEDTESSSSSGESSSAEESAESSESESESESESSSSDSEGSSSD